MAQVQPKPAFITFVASFSHVIAIAASIYWPVSDLFYSPCSMERLAMKGLQESKKVQNGNYTPK